MMRPAVEVEVPSATTPELAEAALYAPRLRAGLLPLEEVPTSPCTAACPAGVNVKAYVSLIAEQRFAEALEVVRERCPLPGVCGRICTHPCETACSRSGIDAALSIRNLKRFVADQEEKDRGPAPPLPGIVRPTKVAVIGSGPGGLTAAWNLRLAGYPVTVFEAHDEPGGMLRYGIAAYRLPHDVLQSEIDHLVDNGIELRTQQRLGKDLDLESLRAEGYGAVIVAVGAQKGRVLGLAGEEELAEVEDALGFLMRANTGDRTHPGERVLVIGGGSTAIEAARTALRLGASQVEVLYRRTREEMPADEEEIDAALAEGVSIRFLVAPQALVIEDGALRGLQCLRMALGDADESGRRSPIPIPGTEFIFEADRVLAAVSQQADLSFLPPGGMSDLTDRGKMRVGGDHVTTRLAGVFACGDVVSGPSTVIEAIAGGHHAAAAVRRYIEGDEFEDRRPIDQPREYELPDEKPIPEARHHAATQPITAGHEYDEVEAAFTVEDAVAEAHRCLRCGPCSECEICAPSCHHRHVALQVEGAVTGPPVRLRIPASTAGLLDDAPTPGWLLPTNAKLPAGGAPPELGVPVNLLPVRARIEPERCRGCDHCVQACPFDAIELRNGTGPLRAHVDPVLCRGCGLCTAVCPTGAALPLTRDRYWWSQRLAVIRQAATALSPPGGPLVLLVCERRIAALLDGHTPPEMGIELVPVSCVGQVTTRMVIDAYHTSPRGVIVAGCASGECHFDSGPDLAMKQVKQARQMVELLGGEHDRILADCSGCLDGDLLGVLKLLIPRGKGLTANAPGMGGR